jgi:predicted O-methyltransferase YrrM
MKNQAVLQQIKTIEGWLTDSEALLLFHLARLVKGEGQIVEIGSFQGKSTVCLAYGAIDSGKNGYVWAIDPHEGVISKAEPKVSASFAAFEKNIKQAKLTNTVRSLRLTSAQAVKRWKGYIRLLFIDGLHDYQSVAEDIAYWSPFVVRDGIIAFHDGFCGQTGVEQAIKRHIFTRRDIINLGTASSIVFVEFGSPTFRQKSIVSLKKFFYTLALFLHHLPLPWIIKLVLIHRFIRLLLMTDYTSKVYTRSV